MPKELSTQPHQQEMVKGRILSHTGEQILSHQNERVIQDQHDIAGVSSTSQGDKAIAMQPQPEGLVILPQLQPRTGEVVKDMILMELLRQPNPEKRGKEQI